MGALVWSLTFQVFKVIGNRTTYFGRLFGSSMLLASAWSTCHQQSVYVLSLFYTEQWYAVYASIAVVQGSVSIPVNGKTVVCQLVYNKVHVASFCAFVSTLSRSQTFERLGTRQALRLRFI